MLSGKSNFIVNLLLREDKRLYKDEFLGENVFLFSASSKSDEKMKTLINNLEIPKENVFNKYDEEVLEIIVDTIEENFNEAKEEYKKTKNENDKPKQSLIIFDDMSFGGNFKNSGIMEKIVCNGRHYLLNIIMTAQKYTQVPTCVREQATGVVWFGCSDKQLDLIVEDHNYLIDKKTFKKMFRNETNERHSFLFINYTNPHDKMYQNKNFIPIKMVE
jgi:hypothetical protein